MHIVVKNSDLLMAMQLVKPALDNKAGFETSMVYLRAVKGSLFFHTSNYYSEVITKIDVEVKEEGEVLISPQKIVDTCRTADKEMPVSIKTSPDASKIQVKTKTFSFHLNCSIDVGKRAERIRAQFPLKNKPSAVLELQSLLEFYKRVQFCTLPEVSGTVQLDAIKLNFSKDSCEAFATDRTIAAKVSVSKGDIAGDPVSILLSGDELGLLSKVFTDQKESKVSMTLNSEKSMVFFSANNTIYGSRLLAGGFPDINSLTKTQPLYKFNLITKEFLIVSQRARLFANSNKTVKISFAANSITLTTYAEKGQDGSDFTESIQLAPGSEVKDLPEGLEIYVNIEYIINVFSSSSASEVTLGFTNDKTPLRFQEASSDVNKGTTTEYIMIGRSKW